MTGRPNLVIFMTDQQRGATVSGDHPLRARTPRLDAFAADATTCTAAYAPSPHCCPSRTSFFTGRYPSEHGVWNNVNVPNALSRGPREGTAFWSSDLAAAGYRMGFTGKWHVANRRGPSDYGWQGLPPTTLWRGDALSSDRQRAESLADQREALRRARPSDADGVRGPGEILRPGWPACRCTANGTTRSATTRSSPPGSTSCTGWPARRSIAKPCGTIWRSAATRTSCSATSSTRWWRPATTTTP